jgi:hypothetical protein
MEEKIKNEYPFISIENKDNLYYVFGYFGRLMFIATDLKEIYNNLKEMFK